MVAPTGPLVTLEGVLQAPPRTIGSPGLQGLPGILVSPNSWERNRLASSGVLPDQGASSPQHFHPQHADFGTVRKDELAAHNVNSHNVNLSAELGGVHSALNIHRGEVAEVRAYFTSVQTHLENQIQDLAARLSDALAKVVEQSAKMAEQAQQHAQTEKAWRDQGDRIARLEEAMVQLANRMRGPETELVALKQAINQCTDQVVSKAAQMDKAMALVHGTLAEWSGVKQDWQQVLDEIHIKIQKAEESKGSEISRMQARIGLLEEQGMDQNGRIDRVEEVDRLHQDRMTRIEEAMRDNRSLKYAPLPTSPSPPQAYASFSTSPKPSQAYRRELVAGPDIALTNMTPVAMGVDAALGSRSQHPLGIGPSAQALTGPPAMPAPRIPETTMGLPGLAGNHWGSPSTGSPHTFQAEWSAPPLQ